VAAGPSGPAARFFGVQALGGLFQAARIGSPEDLDLKAKRAEVSVERFVAMLLDCAGRDTCEDITAAAIGALRHSLAPADWALASLKNKMQVPVDSIGQILQDCQKGGTGNDGTNVSGL
jgi:hypothetical protein